MKRDMMVGLRPRTMPLLVLFAGLVIFGGPGARAAAPKPDILFLMPDQMRGDCLSLLGHPVVRTPNLDKLAQEGALFRRAYSTCPSCIPARHSLLTGLFPATSGLAAVSHLFAKNPASANELRRLSTFLF